MLTDLRARTALSRGLATTALLAATSLVAATGPSAASVASTAAPPGMSAHRSERVAGCVRKPSYRKAHFPSLPRIDNPLLPLVPGTQLELRGFSNVTGQPLGHEVTFTVTDLMKEVDGVRSLIVYDVDTNDGALGEVELAFFAQDRRGNVWNFGEYPEEYGDDGELLGAPTTWLAGSQRAEPGVHMRAAPAVTRRPYVQGFAPRIDFLDCARVTATGQAATVPAGDFTGVLVTEETSPLDAEGGSQIKVHAPGVGIVQVDFVDDPEGEVLQLVERRVLTRNQLWRVRNQALALDARAYDVSRVYRVTEPARRCWRCAR